MTSKLKLLATISALAIALTGCGKDNSDSENKIRVGVMAGSEAQVAEFAAEVAEEQGLIVELVTFTDYVTPNAALDSGAIDVNAFQHKPYLDSQMQDRGYKFVIAGNTFVYPIAGYSKKIQNINELTNGARIAVPNDPTNLGRSLLLLQQNNVIKVDETKGLLPTVRDITENTKKVKIIELEAHQLPRALDDVDLSIINTTYASSINLTPTRDGLIVEDQDSPYVNLIVAREDNVGSRKVKQFVSSYQTDKVHKEADKIFSGGVVKGW